MQDVVSPVRVAPVLDELQRVLPGTDLAPDLTQAEGLPSMAAMMRAGAQMRPQGFGALFELRYMEPLGPNGEVTIYSCALGAAIEGSGYQLGGGDVPRYPLESVLMTELAHAHNGLDCLEKQLHYDMHGVLVFDPAGQHVERQTMTIVVESLNDERFWSREQIADWLETVEPRYRINGTYYTRSGEVCHYVR